MTEDEAYKVHIQYTFNAFCKVVIRHAAIDIILKLRRRWEREVSLDYLMNEKFVQFAEPEQIEEYLLNACGQTAVLYHAELAAALALLPEQAQEEIFRYYFLRQPQRVISPIQSTIWRMAPLSSHPVNLDTRAVMVAASGCSKSMIRFMRDSTDWFISRQPS